MDDTTSLLIDDHNINQKNHGTFQNRDSKSYTSSVNDNTNATSLLDLIIMNSFVFVYGLIQVSYFMLILPKECELLFPKEEAVGLASMLGLAGLSQLISPIAGLFSDRMVSPFGRRRPFILGGGFLSLIALYGLFFFGRNIRLVQSTDTVSILPDGQVFYIVAFFVLNVGLNICFAAYSGLIPDLVEPTHIGKASGIMGVMSATGSLAGVYLIGVVNMEPYSVYLVTLAIVVVITIVTIKEKQYDGQPESIGLTDVFYVYFESLKDNDFFWVWVSRLFYYMGISVQVFMQYFVRDTFLLNEDDAKSATALTSMITLAGSALVAAPFGVLSDSMRRKPIVYISCGFMIIVYTGWAMASSIYFIFAWSLLYGIANGAYLSVDYALACDTLPDREGHAAEALGVWGVAAFLGSTLGPVISGPLLYFVGSTPETDVYSRDGYNALLGVGSGFLVLSALALSRLEKNY